MKYLLCLLAIAVLVAAMPSQKPPDVPVQIKVEKVEGDTATFQPVLQPAFEGILVKGKLEPHIIQCEATAEPVAKLANGNDVVNMVLNCKGGVKIAVTRVLFTQY